MRGERFLENKFVIKPGVLVCVPECSRSKEIVLCTGINYIYDLRMFK